MKFGQSVSNQIIYAVFFVILGLFIVNKLIIVYLKKKPLMKLKGKKIKKQMENFGCQLIFRSMPIFV